MGNVVSQCEEGSGEATGEVVVAEYEEPVTPPEDSGTAVEGEGEPEEEPEVVLPKLRTAPIDFRFPSVNQARCCYTHYNEFYKCLKEKEDPENPDCVYHKRYYEEICPYEWIERWEELREEGRWYGKY